MRAFLQKLRNRISRGKFLAFAVLTPTLAGSYGVVSHSTAAVPLVVLRAE